MSDSDLNHPHHKPSNRDIKRQQWQRFLLIAGVLAITIILGYGMLGDHSNSKKRLMKSTPPMMGATADDFTGSETQTLQEKQQADLVKLSQLVKTLSAREKQSDQVIQKDQATFTAFTTQQTQLQSRVQALQTIAAKNTRHNTEDSSFSDEREPVMPSISVVDYHYPHPKRQHSINPNNYVPAGAFARAVLLGGADANASVYGQYESAPILMRVLSNATLPNGAKANLKGCFVIASVFGDVSSERGIVRLTHLSCVQKNHQILDIPVEGSIYGLGGKDGVRGHVVMRNGKLLMFAGMSGALSGIGSAIQQTLTTQSISPLGATQTVSPQNVWKYGAAGGAKSALDKLSDYYIKRADQYHPVIEVNAGTVVDILFLKGFSLQPNQNKPTKARAQVDPSEDDNQAFSQKARVQQLIRQQQRDEAMGPSPILQNHAV